MEAQLGGSVFILFLVGISEAKTEVEKQKKNEAHLQQVDGTRKIHPVVA